MYSPCNASSHGLVPPVVSVFMPQSQLVDLVPMISSLVLIVPRCFYYPISISDLLLKMCFLMPKRWRHILTGGIGLCDDASQGEYMVIGGIL